MNQIQGQIPTERAARYAKQLAGHWAAKATVQEEADGAVRITMGPDTWTLLTPQPQRLVVQASSPEFGEVVKRHLERFGQRDELILTWD